MSTANGRQRVIIAGVTPEIDGGRFPIKRILGEKVVVETDIFADGPDVLAGQLLYRAESEAQWCEVPLAPLGNDRWRGAFTVSRLGRYRYTLRAWVDPFTTWRHGLDFPFQAAAYGGANHGNLGGVEAASIPSHGRPYSLTLELPPLGMEG